MHGYRTDTNVRGLWLVKRTIREKKLHARELSPDQSILRFDVILQHNLPIEQCLLHIRVFFGGFDLFVHWLIKQITNTCRVIPKPLSKVIPYENRSKMNLRILQFFAVIVVISPHDLLTIQIRHWVLLKFHTFPHSLCSTEGLPPPSQFYRKRSNCPKAERRFYY